MKGLIPVNEMGKTFFVYSSRRYTYVGVVFQGNTFKVKTIPENIESIDLVEIENTIKNIRHELPAEFPAKQFSRLPQETIVKLKQDWKKGFENEMYFAIPRKGKEVFKDLASQEQLVFVDNHNHCVMEGIKRIIAEINGLSKSHS